MKKLTIGLYGTTIIGLFFYSFTQVDLGLTITKNLFLQHIEQSFQYIGYFNRPLSTWLYVALLLLLSLSYIFLIRLVREEMISKKAMMRIIVLTAGFLAFSYTAFSYDIFNYIFDAKIITHYHANPYLHKALDYPKEPMLAFMHWTHRVYPYGPIWLVITVPLSFIGMNHFIPTYFLFKILSSASYLGTVFFIGKILKKVKPDFELLGMAAFALNPLVIIETLVTGHNDIVMLFFAMLGIYFLVEKRVGKSVVSLLISIGIKYATVVLLPVYIYVLTRGKKTLDWDKVFAFSLVLLTISLIAVTLRTNYQPWYLLYILPFTSLLSDREYIFLPSLILSVVSLFLYVPFLYRGDWNPPVPAILQNIELSGLVVAGITGVVLYFLLRRHKAT